MVLLTAREAAKYLRISLFTLARVDKEGLLVPFRTPGGHRRYSLEMLDEYLERSRSQPAGLEKRILVVDEGDDLVNALADTFSSHSFCRADDSLSVGMKLAEFKPHLVLVNTDASGLDGVDLCQRLSERGNEVKILAFEAPRERKGRAQATGILQSSLGVLTEIIEQTLGD